MNAENLIRVRQVTEHAAAMERMRRARELVAPCLNWLRLQLRKPPVMRRRRQAGLSFKGELLRVYGLTVVPLLALITTLIVIHADHEHDHTLASLRHSTRAAAQELDNRFNQQIALLRTLAGSRALDEGDLARFYVEAERALQTQPEWRTIVLSEPTSAQQVVNLLRPLGSPLPTFPDRVSHDTVVSTGQPIIVARPNHRGPLTREPVFGIRVPVTRNGRVVYVLSAALDPRVLQVMLQDLDLPREWIGALLDARGVIVACDNCASGVIGRSAQPSVLRQMHAGAPDVIEMTTRSGVESWLAVSRAPASGWAVAAGVPKSALASLWLNQIWILGVGGFAIFVIAIGNLGWILIRRRREHAVLEAATNKALEAEAEKSRFLAAASHDLRQPLHAADLYLSALRLRLEQPEQQTICAKAQQALIATSNILRALLDISRFESGAFSPSFQAVAIHELIEFVVAQNMAPAQAKQLVLKAEVSEPCIGYSDPGLLERIIDNLVSNAVRYTETGTVVVRCGPRGASAYVEVTDTGVGIPEEALGAIFDQYVRASRHAGGLGLGLAISKHVASLLGCSIRVQSRLGHGSTFVVDIPGAGSAAALPVRDASTNGARRDVPTGEVRVLLVEDDASVCDAMLMLLQQAGVEVRAASDGEGALVQLADGFKPNVIVSDYQLPDINGAALIARLRTELGPVRALLVTADTRLRDAGDVKDCLLVHKPLSPMMLIGLVKQLAMPLTCEPAAAGARR